MSGVIEKIKDVVSGHKDNKDHSEHTSGPHNSDTANRADPRVDSDNSGHHGHGTTGTHTGTTGAYGSSHTGGYDNTSSGTGSTASNLAHKIDPRTDDRSGPYSSGTAGYQPGHQDATHQQSGAYGANPQHYDGSSSGNYGSGLTNTQGYGGSTNAGPHNSNIANKLDPRVDSDRDGSNTTGGYGQGSTGYGSTGTTGEYGSSGLTGGHHQQGHHTGGATGLSSIYHDYESTGTGTHGTHGSTGYGTTGGSTNAGPHNSNVANKLDPRVDSDRDGSNTTGGYGQGTTGGYGQSTTEGYGQGTTGSYGSNTTGHHHGTGENYGSSGNTTQPHSSSLLNKLDPRVDSDRTNTGNTGRYDERDTFDAAQVPPSQFQKEAGHPFATQGSKSGGSGI